MEVVGDREPESVWRDRVSAWRSSGLSRREYCAAAGISAKRFGWWIWRLSRSDAAPARFVPVSVVLEDVGEAAEGVETVDADPAASRSAVMGASDEIEIAPPDGVVVRVGTGVDGVALRRVLTALGR